MKIPFITEDTKRTVDPELREELECLWDKETVDKGYGHFESDIFDLPGKPSFAKHIERIDDIDAFNSDMEAAFYAEKFFGEKIFHYDIGEDEQVSFLWFVDEPQTRRDVEAYLERRFGKDHGLTPDYETVRREEILLENLAEDLKYAVAIEYKGIVFDEWTVDDCGIWGEMCQCCADKYKDELVDELSEGGQGACSVKGCDVVGDLIDTSAHYYVDFKPELICPLSREQLQALQQDSSLTAKIQAAQVQVNDDKSEKILSKRER